MNTQEIDAKNQSLGRVASKIAYVLRGKTDPKFIPNQIPQVKVTVKNASKIKITGKKMDDKVYYHYSGYPGGMKERSLRNVFEKDPSKLLRQCVYRMLAPNKLRDKIIKNLKIEN